MRRWKGFEAAGVGQVPEAWRLLGFGVAGKRMGRAGMGSRKSGNPGIGVPSPLSIMASVQFSPFFTLLR